MVISLIIAGPGKTTKLTIADANMGNPTPNQERKKELAAIAEFAYVG